MMNQSNEEYVVLVVDDSTDTVSMLNDALESEGFSVLVALSGIQALSICKKITPDIILLDAVMPELSGFETCKKLKELPSLESVPVIFMTGLDSSENVESSFASGASDYIQKPIRIVELIARINTHIKKAKQIRTSRELLESFGHITIAVDDEGKINWSTPQVQEILIKSGMTKIQFVSEFPVFLKSFLSKASIGDSKVIPNTSPQIELKLDSKNNEVSFLNLSQMKEKPNEIELLANAFTLTKREAEVLFWVAQGKSNKELAMILDISPRTVNKHLESVFEKMLVENRTTATNMAVKILNKN